MSETTEQQAAPKKPVLWLRDLQERWDVSDVTLWRMRRDRKIPAPTITLGKRVGWATKVIEDFEEGKAAAEPAAERKPARKQSAVKDEKIVNFRVARIARNLVKAGLVDEEDLKS